MFALLLVLRYAFSYQIMSTGKTRNLYFTRFISVPIKSLFTRRITDSEFHKCWHVVSIGLRLDGTCHKQSRDKLESRTLVLAWEQAVNIVSAVFTRRISYCKILLVKYRRVSGEWGEWGERGESCTYYNTYYVNAIVNRKRMRPNKGQDSDWRRLRVIGASQECPTGGHWTVKEGWKAFFFILSVKMWRNI